MSRVLDYAKKGEAKLDPHHQIGLSVSDLYELNEIARKEGITDAILKAYCAGIEVGSRIKEQK